VIETSVASATSALQKAALEVQTLLAEAQSEILELKFGDAVAATGIRAEPPVSPATPDRLRPHTSGFDFGKDGSGWTNPFDAEGTPPKQDARSSQLQKGPAAPIAEPKAHGASQLAAHLQDDAFIEGLKAAMRDQLLAASQNGLFDQVLHDAQDAPSSRGPVDAGEIIRERVRELLEDACRSGQLEAVIQQEVQVGEGMTSKAASDAKRDPASVSPELDEQATPVDGDVRARVKELLRSASRTGELDGAIKRQSLARGSMPQAALELQAGEHDGVFVSDDTRARVADLLQHASQSGGLEQAIKQEMQSAKALPTSTVEGGMHKSAPQQGSFRVDEWRAGARDVFGETQSTDTRLPQRSSMLTAGSSSRITSSSEDEVGFDDFQDDEEGTALWALAHLLQNASATKQFTNDISDDDLDTSQSLGSPSPFSPLGGLALSSRASLASGAGSPQQGPTRSAKAIGVQNPPPSEASLRELFEALDSTNTGHLGKFEMRCFMTLRGVSVQKSAWETRFEMLRSEQGWSPRGPTFKEFAAYASDRHGSGYCSEEEVTRMLAGVGAVKDAVAIFDNLDKDENGRIDKEEFDAGLKEGSFKPGSFLGLDALGDDDNAPKKDPRLESCTQS